MFSGSLYLFVFVPKFGGYSFDLDYSKDRVQLQNCDSVLDLESEYSNAQVCWFDSG